jgi:endogenous inhibitor of DNA gyrase (YacG/DUF329 family)
MNSSVPPKSCERCGSLFIGNAKAKYCSPRCKQRDYRERLEEHNLEVEIEERGYPLPADIERGIALLLLAEDQGFLAKGVTRELLIRWLRKIPGSPDQNRNKS